MTNTTQPATKPMTMAEHFEAAKPHGYPNWNPVTHPWRVSFYYHGSHTANLSTHGVFATEIEARAAYAAVMPKVAFKASIAFARNASEWQTRGGWTFVESRKRGQKPVSERAS
jgi:hypothetical protein